MMEPEEVDRYVESIEEMRKEMAKSISEEFGIDVERVEESYALSNWAEGYKDFLMNPIEHYQASKEKSKQLIKKYQKRIRKHKKKINRLDMLIENEKMDREG